LQHTLLKNRIKKNEGFSKKPYKDQTGHYTIGYGHLILSNEKYFFEKKFDKIFFEKLFDKDFNNALNLYKKNYNKFFFSKQTKNLLIEMIFQMGIKKVRKFSKMMFHIKNNNKYLTSLEMLDSLWYKQTPSRVNNLIKHYLKK
tara:strand:+ start:129 stop:557 length:429 start_codon:yes stop_codon:yes gene_type:complete